jgi:Family of unknown function (DUF6014)
MTERKEDKPQSDEGDRSTQRTGIRDEILGALLILTRQPQYPQAWVKQTIESLLSGDYSELRTPFCEIKFVGPDGDFVLAGPYTVLREAQQDQRLSGIVGRTLPPPDLPVLDHQIEELVGPLRQSVPHLLPVEVIQAWGNLDGERGEAFVVPSSWEWMESSDEVGPAINNMTEQWRRWESAAFSCIETIFDARSADLLLDPVRERVAGITLQAEEYQLHDGGHAAGLGLDYKLRENLLSNYWLQGVEEWRADGIDFELACRVLPPDHAYRIHASNMITRFGLDAHRGGGVDRDYDVAVVVLTLDRLMQSGSLCIRGNRLSFTDPTPRGLLRATELHRTEALQLTRRELNLAHSQGLARLYSAITPSRETEEIFINYVVEPCRGYFAELR